MLFLMPPGTKFFLKIPNIVSTEDCLVLSDLKTIYAFPTRSIQWIRTVAQVDFQKHSTIRSIVHEKNIIPVHNASDLFGNLTENLDELEEKIILINIRKSFALSYKGKLPILNMYLMSLIRFQNYHLYLVLQ